MATRTNGRQRPAEKHNNPFSNFDLNATLAMDTPYIDITIPHVEKRIGAFKISLGKYTTINQEEVMKRRDLHVQEIESLRVEKTRIEQDLQTYRLKEIALAKRALIMLRRVFKHGKLIYTVLYLSFGGGETRTQTCGGAGGAQHPSAEIPARKTNGERRGNKES
jgi:hypothetical protein